MGFKRIINPDSHKRPHGRFMSGNDLLEGREVAVTQKCHWFISMTTTDFSR